MKVYVATISMGVEDCTPVKVFTNEQDAKDYCSRIEKTHPELEFCSYAPVMMDSITVWDKCSLRNEPGSYEEGYGSEWVFESTVHEDFATGRSDMEIDTEFHPREGSLVFLPAAGEYARAERARKLADKWLEEEGKKLDVEIRRMAKEQEGK
jgi:hypothetical protein